MKVSMYQSMARRDLLKWLAVGPAALSLALHRRLAVAEAQQIDHLALAPRELSMRNLHTDERIQVRYFEDGRYLPQATQQLNRLLRDHRTGEIAVMDQRLFDQLHVLAAGAGRIPHYEIISGYRSPATNEKLRAGSKGVARQSLHTHARAVDVRLSGISCGRLRELAIGLQLGGVGFYAASDFVHLDTGRVRTWTG
jgi:uncharacterized protein YcbK (DUF882 family)